MLNVGLVIQWCYLNSFMLKKLLDLRRVFSVAQRGAYLCIVQ